MPYQLFDMIAQFHQLYAPDSVGDPRAPNVLLTQSFRLALIEEELQELKTALATPTDDPADQLAEVADGIGDLVYVLVGCAIAWGIDLPHVLLAIHESNMSKTPNPGGKPTKGLGFQPVNLRATLAESAEEFREQPELFGNVNGEAVWPIPSSDRARSGK